MRGFNGCEYHGDVLNKFVQEELKYSNCKEDDDQITYSREGKEFKISCPGGGRILH